MSDQSIVIRDVDPKTIVGRLNERYYLLPIPLRVQSGPNTALLSFSLVHLSGRERGPTLLEIRAIVYDGRAMSPDEARDDDPHAPTPVVIAHIRLDTVEGGWRAEAEAGGNASAKIAEMVIEWLGDTYRPHPLDEVPGPLTSGGSDRTCKHPALIQQIDGAVIEPNLPRAADAERVVAQVDLEEARLRLATGFAHPADANGRDPVTVEVYVPTYPKVFNRWCDIWEIIKLGVAKGRSTKDLYDDLKKRNKALARLGGTDTLPKIIAAGQADLLDRKVERT